MKAKLLLGIIGFSLMPIATNAQLIQDASRSTSVIVRDPARQASTEIDAVINNPAGTAFLNDGWHLSFSGLLTVGSMNTNFMDENSEKIYRNVFPSLQAAYKKGNFTYSFSFANEGGYGHWFNSRDPLYSHIANTSGNNVFNDFKETMSQLVPNSCDMNDKLIYDVKNYGDNYNFTARLGAAYKINDHWSVYAGIRMNYVTDRTHYEVSKMIQNNNLNILTPQTYFTNVDEDLNEIITDATLALILTGAGDDKIEELRQLAKDASDLNKEFAQTPNYITDYKRMNGWGLSPVIGVDYKTGKFNFAANYEFDTKIHTNSGYTSFHIPGKLSLGASWQIKDNLTIALGGSWTHFTTSKTLGSSQSVDIDPDLVFNSETTKDARLDFSASGKGELFDISASVSFSPIKHLVISAGYTFAKQGGSLIKSSLPISVYLPSTHGNYVDVLSGGISYEISEKAQINLGISKRYQRENHAGFSDWNINNHQNLTVSAGIDFIF